MSNEKARPCESRRVPLSWWQRQSKSTVQLACVLLGLLASTAHARAPTVDQIVTANGVSAWLVEEHSVPLVAIRFAFAGGAAQDPQGKEGLAAMVSDLLTEGAGDLSAQAFKEPLSGLGVRLAISSGRDAVRRA
jgi:zinc protease